MGDCVESCSEVKEDGMVRCPEPADIRRSLVIFARDVSVL